MKWNEMIAKERSSYFDDFVITTFVRNDSAEGGNWKRATVENDTHTFDKSDKD